MEGLIKNMNGINLDKKFLFSYVYFLLPNLYAWRARDLSFTCYQWKCHREIELQLKAGNCEHFRSKVDSGVPYLAATNHPFFPIFG